MPRSLREECNEYLKHFDGETLNSSLRRFKRVLVEKTFETEVAFCVLQDLIARSAKGTRRDDQVKISADIEITNLNCGIKQQSTLLQQSKKNVINIAL